MNYVLSKIVEHDILVRQGPEAASDEELVAQWSFGVQPRFNSETEIEIYVSTAMTPGFLKDGEEKPRSAEDKVLEISVSHVFQLAEPHPLYPFNEDTVITEEQKMELATLVGVSVGTLRGLTYARTAAILGESLIMPVLNPLEMLEHFLVKIQAQYEYKEN